MKVFVVAALVMFACTESPEPSGPFVDSRVETKEIPLVGVPRLDVLVVVERSPSMVEHVDRVRAQLPVLVDVLETLPGGVPDLHLGVIAADGPMLRTSPMLHGAFIWDRPLSDGTRQRNYVGRMEEVLASLIDAGTGGPATSAPIANVLAAFNAEYAPNAGFLRPEAYLAVVIVAATDDASGRPVADLAVDLKGMKGDPTRVIVSTIAADAPRLDAFRAQFPNRNGAAAIASEDYGDAFEPLAQATKILLGLACWEEATVDAECVAWTDEATVPRCGSGVAGMCWRMESKPDWCTTGSGTVTRFENVVNLPADGVVVTMQCVIAPNS